MTGPVGVYVHIPFCRSRCDYCAFATWSDRDELVERYVLALTNEIDGAVQRGELDRIHSIFVGGGTPSRLDPYLLAGVITTIGSEAGIEVTVECNPEDLVGVAGRDRLDVLAGVGVNRISLGGQSTVPHVLADLGRRHGHQELHQAVATIGSSPIDNFNVDAIFGAVSERDADWAKTLSDVLALDPAPTHISLYALTVEPGTALAADPLRHPDNDLQADRYEVAQTRLEAAGYAHYEISNWARPGYECRHNLNTWRLGNYRGFGASAHSHHDGRRFWNIRTIERYCEAVERGVDPVAGEEFLTPEERRLERLMLGLRTADGVPWPGPIPPAMADLVVRHGDRLVLSAAGRLLHSEVVGELWTAGGGDGESAE